VVEYLSCHIVESKNEAKLTLIQPHLLIQLTQKIRKEIKEMRKYLTPGNPRFKIQMSTEDLEVISDDFQRKYRSGVGMLLF
jgi:hypothetical protein